MKLQTKLIFSFIVVVIVTTGLTFYFLENTIEEHFENFLEKRERVTQEDIIINGRPAMRMYNVREMPKDSPEFIFLQSSRQALLQSAIVGIVISCLLVLLFAPYYLRRLRLLSHAMEDYGETGNMLSLQDNQNDEISSLILTYNTLLQRIEHQKEVRKNFFIDMSHEIKTPLTAIQGYLQGILDGVFQNDKEITAKTLHETQRLIHLVKEMTHLAKLESEDIVLKNEKTDIVHMTSDVIEGFSQQQDSIVLHSPKTLYTFVDADKMKQVFINLIHNALEYRRPHTPIQIEIKVNTKGWEWFISNTTDEVTERDLEFLFDRFYRKDASRVYNKEEPHLGVGLAIVKRIIEAHGGTTKMSLDNSIICFHLSFKFPHIS